MRQVLAATLSHSLFNAHAASAGQASRGSRKRGPEDDGYLLDKAQRVLGLLFESPILAGYFDLAKMQNNFFLLPSTLYKQTTLIFSILHPFI